MVGVLIKDQPQVPFAGDQHRVQALAACAGDPSFGDRARTGAPALGPLVIRAPSAASTAPEPAVNVAARCWDQEREVLPAIAKGS
jgi:hypothetical protein